MTIPPDAADPYRQVTLTVEGGDVRKLVEKALKLAADFLGERVEDLYASEIGNAICIQRSRYRPHLGMQGKPIRWQATVKVRLRVEIVRARRGEDPDPDPPAPGPFKPKIVR